MYTTDTVVCTTDSVEDFFFFLIKKLVKRREAVSFWKWNMKTRRMDKQ